MVVYKTLWSPKKDKWPKRTQLTLITFFGVRPLFLNCLSGLRGKCFCAFERGFGSLFFDHSSVEKQFLFKNVFDY